MKHVQAIALPFRSDPVTQTSPGEMEGVILHKDKQ